ncbi:MAG: TIGR04283 family arsenosugar biosynthesis glycosyltransferase [Desulfuromonadaceae bacterium]|nr:TIGR04283 family arsenosugar biosynthesis glycosyltransferase [Desulfuromonadaceae bacterium]MDD2848829.1 TIGR04283 family arsenosugar biosynthesis glycosyltransferase [Desulfuromonadaceae bacterium]MDD4132214.1 TIGR04283 family arsenosugar biosynthesis glycosyltransferase [Desulfuromonadaceae bacterium]
MSNQLQNPQPLLSIIIPTLNEAELLPLLLEDIKQQQNISLEIIVGDGGSLDATRSVAEQYGAGFVTAGRGRGKQMNAAAEQASGDYLLFLHADSRIDCRSLLGDAVHALLSESTGQVRTAGHFPLRFMRSTENNAIGYRYVEEKSAFNRVDTTNGDQGLLLAKGFFRSLGGFDESMPFLEDQRIAAKIRSTGNWITLPGYLKTSARRFETEGFHRRYILMSMMMGLYSVGAEAFFVRAPGVYRQQQDAGTLLLSPFFSLIWRMMFDEWGGVGTLRIFYLLGRYIRQNSWQMFFFIDVLSRSLLGAGRYPFLRFHDRIFWPCSNFKLFDALTGAICFVWFMGVLSPFFWLVDNGERLVQKRSAGSGDRI